LADNRKIEPPRYTTKLSSGIGQIRAEYSLFGGDAGARGCSSEPFDNRPSGSFIVTLQYFDFFDGKIGRACTLNVRDEGIAIPVMCASSLLATEIA
jgi:hypothetical protein